MLEAFSVYLAGHNRPPHEILNGKNKNIKQLYESAFMGMTRDEAPTVEILNKDSVATSSRNHIRF